MSIYSAEIPGRLVAILLCSLFVLMACDEPANKSRQKSKPAHLIETATAQIRDIAIEHQFTSTLQAIREVKIINQRAGQLISLPYHPGDAVKQGQILAQLDDTLAIAELKKAEASLQQAQLDLRRLRDLAPRKLASESEIAQAETLVNISRAEQQLKQAELTFSRIEAPIDGVIASRLVEPGDVLPLHTMLLQLLDTSSLKAKVQVSEHLLPTINPGQSVEVRIDALGKQSNESQAYNAKVIRIYPAVDKQTRKGTLEIQLQPVPEGAIPGQLCRVSIRTMQQARLMIPFDAVRHDRQGSYVFIIEKDTARRKTIITGIEQDNHIEVIDGLTAGTVIVTQGLFGLEDGMKVNNVNASPTATGQRLESKDT